MSSPEQSLYIDQNHMGGDASSPDILESTAGIGEAVRPVRDEGIATQTLQIKEAGGSRPNLEYMHSYLRTEVSRRNSPFYLDEDNIGLEDKLLGREDILIDEENPDRSPVENVTRFFAERGAVILNGMEAMYGEDYAARARALMRTGGKLAPFSSEQGKLDRQIVGHLEQAYSAFVRQLNTNITTEGYNFRREIVDDLEREAKTKGVKDEGKILDLYSAGTIDAKPKGPESGYAKEKASEVLEKLPPSQRSSWGFMKNLARTLSNPFYRTQSRKMSQSVI